MELEISKRISVHRAGRQIWLKKIRQNKTYTAS